MKDKDFIQKYFRIVDKNGAEVPFVLNAIQDKYLTHDYTGYDFILKARQQGFSSLILALFTSDFIRKNNSRSVIVADKSENATELLDRVKFYIQSFEEIAQTKVPLKYNSKYELFNEALNSRYTIGTSENTDFGRSKTITNLHLSEAAFYNYLDKIIAGAGQAVVEGGRFIIETTANGFNYARDLWYQSELGETTFKPLFYPASSFYSVEFLDKKRKELKETFKQEYPDTAEEAFLTSGETFFNTEALRWYLENAKNIQTV